MKKRLFHSSLQSVIVFSMTFHYIRKNDATGTIQRVNGMGVGLALRKLKVRDSKLPLACKVEIIRFAADILNDAMKNGFVHGDIKLDNLAVTNDGSVIINGYDRPRRSSITPEGTMSIPGDIYGLGIVMLELFSGQRGIELPLEQNLHNQTVLQIFLGIDWQEWATQPWLSTMQEYLISLLFFEPSQRPHPLDIANILKEASQTTNSLGIQAHMQYHGLKVSMEQESLEMAQALRSSTLISPVEVMADSEGTATGFFTRDKIAEMFNQPIAEDVVRRTEWSPEPTEPVIAPTVQPAHRPPVPPIPSNRAPSHPHPGDVSLDLPPRTPNAQQWTSSEPDIPTQPKWTPPPTRPVEPEPPKSVQPPVQSQWQPPTSQRVSEQPTATNPAPAPLQPAPPWNTTPNHMGGVQPVEEQPTPSIPPQSSAQPHFQAPPPPPTQPSFQAPPPTPIPPPPTFPGTPNSVPNIGAGQQPPQPSWSKPASPQSVAIGAGGQNLYGTSNQGQMTGGMDKRLLIGAGIGALLFLVVAGVLAWILLSDDAEPVENTTIEVETIRPEKIAEPEALPEPSEDEVEEVEEVEEAPPPPKPKTTRKPTPKQSTSKKTSTRKTSTKKKSTTKTQPKQTTVAPTTVGVGEFSVTIQFDKPATLKCGDGQSKDFVNQTKMTFQTRTACRINTEDGEQGALSASKSGTIQCTLSGTRIRCR